MSRLPSALWLHTVQAVRQGVPCIHGAPIRAVMASSPACCIAAGLAADGMEPLMRRLGERREYSAYAKTLGRASRNMAPSFSKLDLTDCRHGDAISTSKFRLGGAAPQLTNLGDVSLMQFGLPTFTASIWCPRPIATEDSELDGVGSILFWCDPFQVIGTIIEAVAILMIRLVASRTASEKCLCHQRPDQKLIALMRRQSAEANRPSPTQGSTNETAQQTRYAPVIADDIERLIADNGSPLFGGFVKLRLHRKVTPFGAMRQAVFGGAAAHSFLRSF